MTARLTDRTIVVTGAARGIGAGIAHAMAAEGANIVVVDLLAEEAAETAERIVKDGGKAVSIAADVTNREQVRAAIDLAVSEFGRLDAMFNNAGVNDPRNWLDIDKDNWDFITGINGWGVVVGTQEAAKQFIAQGSPGKIINTASIAGRQGYAAIGPYCASKAAVISLTQSAARALAPHNITVNGFAPGVVDTPLWVELDKALDNIGKPELKFAGMAADILLGRPSQPADIAPTAIFLAGPDSDYITGQIIPIDGGMILV
ncbi:SDR family NAD(P)-dependent oxidoreductase [Amycolatopsis viridis]|uniref:Meso-butanediol dehydrogenase/(S,S)-butanediol dehydrogenase/diacetyl reductase n=1 Tax=Amycolatopsis viridis TaxID=185678 RepID=A0ABX0SZ29_9PSEU|nr:glucose 1-dehydrogenase [Amycolatopsis viridis]NIH82238.1 meso-butanediol dehydrogenase/(S,S)-butanediol dehydrogenase/diacetyl reductase [Amycolatopsis viridis]